MEDVPFRPTYASEQQRKLGVAMHYAESASNGDEFFHEYSYKPLTSMFLTTGELIEGEEQKHEVHIHLIEQHSGYPPQKDSLEDVMEYGYHIFCEKNDQNTAESTGVSRTLYTLIEYKEMFQDIKGVIDRATYGHHGIKCFADGDLNHTNAGNMYHMHTCDIFNMMMHEATNTRIRLLIETSLLPFITPQTKHMLEERLLNCTQRFFLLKNIDIFYITYGYYFNRSFVPIRTRVPQNSNHFRISRFFMNDEHFVQHQRGKMKAIDDFELNYLTRLYYTTF